MTAALAITGAAHGIGLAAARLAATAGDAVILIDRDEASLQQAAETCREAGAAAVHTAAFDVSDVATVAARFSALSEDAPFGRLLCSAGIDRGGPSEELPEATWREVLGVDLDGTFACCQAAIRHFLGGEGGSIVCVSSPAALVGLPGGTAAYSAAKGGVSALVRSLAVEFAGRGIRVNAVLPGPTETELMWANADPAAVEELRRQVAAEVPVGRLARPEEPATAALWLLSEAAGFVTGVELAIDGGVLARASVSI